MWLCLFLQVALCFYIQIRFKPDFMTSRLGWVYITVMIKKYNFLEKRISQQNRKVRKAIKLSNIIFRCSEWLPIIVRTFLKYIKRFKCPSIFKIGNTENREKIFFFNILWSVFSSVCFLLPEKTEKKRNNKRVRWKMRKMFIGFHFLDLDLKVIINVILSRSRYVVV